MAAANASAAPAKGGKQRVGAPSAGGAGRTGGGGGGGSFGGGGGRSMDDIIKAEHGIQDASTGGGGGGDGAPVGDGGDPEEMAKAAEAFGEAVAKLWRRFFGRASESPPSPKVSAPPPPGGGTGTGEPVHAVATARQVEPKPTADPAAELGRDLAAYLRKIDRGTLKDGKLLATKLDRQPEGRKLRQVVDAMHGDAELADFAKRLPKSSPPSEVIRRIEEEARRRQREAEQRQRERTAERTQVAKRGAQPSGPALRMGR